MNDQYFMFFGKDKSGVQSIRSEVRPSHRRYLREHNANVEVVLGGPTLAVDNDHMNGTLLIIKASSIQDVIDFINADPYVKSDIFSEKIIRPWVPGLVNQEAFFN